MHLLRLAALLSIVGLVSCATDSPHRRAQSFGEHGPYCADIEAAFRIDFSTDRAARLKRIASVVDLSSHEQVFLIEAALVGGFSSDQADVLSALASNPGLTGEARSYLGSNIERIDFSTERQRVVDAMIENDAGR
ncbi:MAG: hypothetical protein RL885_21660 [Planctomycetota bacterium]